MTRQEISERLQTWHDAAQQIRALFDDRGQRIKPPHGEKAKLIFAELKGDLEAEHKRLSATKMEERLTPDERRSISPPLMRDSSR
jgi:hypothetical protein